MGLNLGVQLSIAFSLVPTAQSTLFLTVSPFFISRHWTSFELYNAKWDMKDLTWDCLTLNNEQQLLVRPYNYPGILQISPFLSSFAHVTIDSAHVLTITSCLENNQALRNVLHKAELSGLVGCLWILGECHNSWDTVLLNVQKVHVSVCLLMHTPRAHSTLNFHFLRSHCHRPLV